MNKTTGEDTKDLPVHDAPVWLRSIHACSKMVRAVWKNAEMVQGGHEDYWVVKDHTARATIVATAVIHPTKPGWLLRVTPPVGGIRENVGLSYTTREDTAASLLMSAAKMLRRVHYGLVREGEDGNNLVADAEQMLDRILAYQRKIATEFTDPAQCKTFDGKQIREAAELEKDLIDFLLRMQKLNTLTSEPERKRVREAAEKLLYRLTMRVEVLVEVHGEEAPKDKSGFREIPRTEFAQLLAGVLQISYPGCNVIRLERNGVVYEIESVIVDETMGACGTQSMLFRVLDIQEDDGV